MTRHENDDTPATSITVSTKTREQLNMKNIPLAIATACILTGCMATVTPTTVAPALAAPSDGPPMPPPPSTISKTKSVTAPPRKPVANPYNITLSFVATPTDPGVLITTNGTKGLTIVSGATPFINSTNTHALRPGKRPQKLAKKTKSMAPPPMPSDLVVALPLESIWYDDSQPGVRIAYIDSFDLEAGRTYQLQSSNDSVTWTTRTTLAWTSTDSNAYWRAGRVVPSDVLFVETYRLLSP